MSIWGSSAGGRNGLNGAQEYARIDADIAGRNGGYHQQVRRSYGQSMESNINSTAASSDLGDRVIAYSVRAGDGTSAWQATASGAHDANIRSFVQSVPANQIVFFCYAHEPEDEGGDPTAFRQAASRFCKIVLDEGNPNVVPTFNLMAFTWRTNTRDPEDWNPGSLMTSAERAASMGAIDGYGGDNPSVRTPEWTYTAPYNTIVGSWGFRFGLYEVGVNAGVSGRGTWMLQLEDWVNARDVEVVCWWHSGGAVDQFWIDGATVNAEPATTETWAGIIGRNQGADIPDVPLPEDTTIPPPITGGPNEDYDQQFFPYYVSLWQPGAEYEVTGNYIYSNSGPDGWSHVSGNKTADYTAGRYPTYNPGGYYADTAAAGCLWYITQTAGITSGFNFYLYDGTCPTPIVATDVTQNGGNPFWVGYRYSYSAGFLGEDHSYDMEFGHGTANSSAEVNLSDFNEQYAAVLAVIPDGADLYEWDPENPDEWSTPVRLTLNVEWVTMDPTQTQSVGLYLAPPGGIPVGQWLGDSTTGVTPQAPGELLATLSGSGETTIEFDFDSDEYSDYLTFYNDEFSTNYPEVIMEFWLIDPDTMGPYPGEISPWDEDYVESHWGPAIRMWTSWTLKTPDYTYSYPDPTLQAPWGWGSAVAG